MRKLELLGLMLGASAVTFCSKKSHVEPVQSLGQDARVIGTAVSLSDYPFVVKMVKVSKQDPNAPKMAGMGTIISNKWIITAAHVFCPWSLSNGEESVVSIAYGDAKPPLNSPVTQSIPLDLSSAKTAKIKRVVTHPKWTCDPTTPTTFPELQTDYPWYLSYDLALVELEQTIPFTNVSMPIAFPSHINLSVLQGVNAIGWSSMKQPGIDLPVVANPNPANYQYTFGDLSISMGGLYKIHTKDDLTHLFVKHLKGGPRPYDSGSPVFVTYSSGSNVQHYLVGVLSQGGTANTTPHIYNDMYSLSVSVQSQFAWIQQTTGF
jgi:secreted trypsin-like serine protease